MAVSSNLHEKSCNALESKLESIQKLVKALVENESCSLWPDQPTSESDIKTILQILSSLDSNNFENGIGAGEREGRIFSKYF